MISRREAAYPSRRTSGSDRLRAIISEAMRLNWLILNISFIFSWFSLGITTGFPPSPGPSRGLARASAVDTDKHTAQTEDAGECKGVSLWSHVYVRQYTLTVSPRQSSLLFVVALVALAEVEQNEHVQHHPHQRGGQNHFTVGEPPHPKSVTRERERERERATERGEEERNIKALAEVRSDGESWTAHTITGFSKAVQRRSLFLLISLCLSPHSPQPPPFPQLYARSSSQCLHLSFRLSVCPSVRLSRLLSVGCLSAPLQMVTFTPRESLKMSTAHRQISVLHHFSGKIVNLWGHLKRILA